LTTTYYFTKWIEVVPTCQATDSIIIQFLERNILSRFGCPRRIITDNDASFKYKKLVEFCTNYGITLSHSKTYYPQGNGFSESSNKSLIRIIKKLLQENKKSWHNKLIFAHWADIVSTNKSIGTPPFQLVYGTKAIFHTSIGLPVMKLLQEAYAKTNHVHRRISQLVHVRSRQNEESF